MVDPVSVIVTAVTAAAPLVGKALVDVTVKDAYAALKGAITKRFKRGAAVAALEEAPESAAAREALAGALRETRAADDSEIRQLAAALLEAIKALPRTELKAASIDIGPLEAAGNAIVEDNWAAGSIEVTSMKAGGDVVVRGNRAGLNDPNG